MKTQPVQHLQGIFLVFDLHLSQLPGVFLDAWPNGSINNHYLSKSSLQAGVNAHYTTANGHLYWSEDHPLAVV